MANLKLKLHLSVLASMTLSMTSGCVTVSGGTNAVPATREPPALVASAPPIGQPTTSSNDIPAPTAAAGVRRILLAVSPDATKYLFAGEKRDYLEVYDLKSAKSTFAYAENNVVIHALAVSNAADLFLATPVNIQKNNAYEKVAASIRRANGARIPIDISGFNESWKAYFSPSADRVFVCSSNTSYLFQIAKEQATRQSAWPGRGCPKWFGAPLRSATPFSSDGKYILLPSGDDGVVKIPLTAKNALPREIRLPTGTGYRVLSGTVHHERAMLVLAKIQPEPGRLPVLSLHLAIERDAGRLAVLEKFGIADSIGEPQFQMLLSTSDDRNLLILSSARVDIAEIRLNKEKTAYDHVAAFRGATNRFDVGLADFRYMPGRPIASTFAVPSPFVLGTFRMYFTVASFGTFAPLLQHTVVTYKSNQKPLAQQLVMDGWHSWIEGNKEYTGEKLSSSQDK